MKPYFADTNFYLRFILQDDLKLAATAQTDLKSARQGKKRVIFLSAVILEMGFVLKSFYLLSHSQIADYLLPLVKTQYLEIEDRDVWLKIFRTYTNVRESLIDIFLLEKALSSNGEVLTFDKNLQKLSLQNNPRP